jgi:metallo-beta-lactamase class B
MERLSMHKFLRFLTIPLAGVALFPPTLLAQPPGWVDPFPPHKIMDNVYFVGTTQLASFLIVTPAGLILMNSNYEANVPVIEAAVKALGFDFKNIKILISGHAHPDHIEGDPLVKELTGAQVVVGRLELPYVQSFKNPKGKTQPVDRVVDDGDTVTLGGTTLTAHVMPGHTKGCLAWTLDLHENGKTYHALVECSLNSQGTQYVDNKDYPDIVEANRATFKQAHAMQVDVLLSSHTIFYGMAEKYAKLKDRQPNDPNPFVVDTAAYQAHVNEFEKKFEDAVAKQLADAKQK